MPLFQKRSKANANPTTSNVNGKLKEIERISSKKPHFFRKVRNGVLLGATVGALGASQGPAVRQQYGATKDTVRQSVEMVQKFDKPKISQAQALRNFFRGESNKIPKVPSVVVGERFRSGVAPDGTKHIGKLDIGVQAMKTYKPRVELTPSSAKQAGKGALYGVGVGAGLGVFGFFRKKRKYKKDLKRALQDEQN